MGKFSSLFARGLLSVAFYAVVKVSYNIYVQFNVLTAVPNPFGNARVVGETCDDIIFKPVKTVRDIHDYASAREIIKQNADGPILFKKYIESPAAEFAAMNLQDTKLLFTVVNVTGFGNTWLGGLSPVGESHRTIEEVLNDKNSSQSTQTLYASFKPFLNVTTMAHSDKHVPIDALVDTNFVSNFPKDVLSTHIHAATLIDSYALQYLGRKIWIMMSPTDMEKYHPVSTPSTFLMKGSEKEHFSRTSPVPIVVQEEGDMLYFPPHWGHAVITKAGPNVMLNYRVPQLNPYAHRKTLLTFLEALTMLAIDTALTGLKSAAGAQYEHEKTRGLAAGYKILGNAERSLGDYNSPCMDKWIVMINA
jgi:hypothetical protein